MRRVLPGGAVLGEKTRVGDDLAVACRPGAAVLESVRPLSLLARLPSTLKRQFASGKLLLTRLMRAQHVQQAVITGAIGLVFTIIGALILAWLKLK